MDSIGEIFENKRKSLGLSLKEIENATKIRTRYLQAIEDDNFDVIPGGAYVKGFIRTYASFLKIDSGPLIKEYEEEYGEPLQYEEEKYIDVREKDVFKRRRLILFFSVVGAILLVLAIVWGIRALNKKTQAPKQEEKIEVPLEDVLPPEEEMPLEEMVPPEEEVSTTDTASALPSAEEEFKIEVTALDRVWLRVFVDEENIFEEILEKDQSKEWTAKESVRIKSGNGELVEVKKDGKLLGELGVGLEEKVFTFE